MTGPYPALADERAAIRQANRKRLVARAEREARRLSTSIKCGEYGAHAPEGCQNKGDGCLCECHDLAAVQ